MKIEKKYFIIKEDCTLKQAMKMMSDMGQKNLFMVDAQKKLIGSLSDGDIRKWILHRGKLSGLARHVCNKKPKMLREDYHVEDVKKLMLEFLIESVPVVNEYREIVKILTWEDIFSGKAAAEKKQLKVPVIIMAGGKGSRLDPFTRILPKPLIPIDDKPILEIIMDKFIQYGINEFFVTVNHKAKMIQSYFEDKQDKYKITYVVEKNPLGTAGGLKLLKGKLRDPFLVTNCDVIIKSDCVEIVKFHNDNGYDMTLVVSCRHYIIPYGVCEIAKGGILMSINEKPEYELLVNTGMYVMKKNVLDLIPSNRVFNVNDLVEKAKEKKLKIGVFPISEDSWIDIGQWEEYHKAIDKIRV